MLFGKRSIHQGLRALLVLMLASAMCACASQTPRQQSHSDAGQTVVGTAVADTQLQGAQNARSAVPADAALNDGMDLSSASALTSSQASGSDGASQTATVGTEDASLHATAEEEDYAAIYGNGDAIGADYSQVYDPWEGFNRRMHAFNNGLDRRIARPVARAYVRFVPVPVRQGVGNFFTNLGQPSAAVNALLQGRPSHAAEALARFLVNMTIGFAGVLDPASTLGLRARNKDFGQTLAVWGWKKSRYLELPLFGPRTLRDAGGMLADTPLSPLTHVNDTTAQTALRGLMLVDMRAQLLSVDSLREGAVDSYILQRDAWLQRRQYQINSDRRTPPHADVDADAHLPDYLQDE